MSLSFLDTTQISHEDRDAINAAVLLPSEHNAIYHLSRLFALKCLTYTEQKWEFMLDALVDLVSDYSEYTLYLTVEHYLKHDDRLPQHQPFFPHSSELLAAIKAYHADAIDLYSRIQRGESPLNPPIPFKYDEFHAVAVCDPNGKNCRSIKQFVTKEE